MQLFLCILEDGGVSLSQLVAALEAGGTALRPV